MNSCNRTTGADKSVGDARHYGWTPEILFPGRHVKQHDDSHVDKQQDDAAYSILSAFIGQ